MAKYVNPQVNQFMIVFFFIVALLIGIAVNGLQQKSYKSDYLDGNLVDLAGKAASARPYVPDIPSYIAYFRALQLQGTRDIQIEWGTSHELDAVSFSIQMSTDGVKFSDVPDTAIAASGTSNTPRYYTTIQKDVDPGRYMYRIRQEGGDGVFYYGDSYSVSVR